LVTYLTLLTQSNILINMSTICYDQVMEFRIRNIPGNIWKEFKILCIREDTTLNDKMIELIKKEVVEKAAQKD